MERASETTVVLAGEDVTGREGIAAFCASHGLRIAGQCDECLGTVEMVLELDPEIVILGLQMPGGSGIEVVRRLRLTGSRVKIVILSDSQERAPMMEALRRGADGYLSIDDAPHQLWNAVRLVRSGGTYVSPVLRNRFGRGRKAKVENPADSLDSHEMEVFSFLSNGLQSQDIADLLEISLSVVEALRTSLMRKLMISGEGTTAIQSRHASNLASLRSEEKRVYSLLADGFPPNEIAERMAISLERFYTLRFRVMQKLNLQSFDFEPPELA